MICRATTQCVIAKDNSEGLVNVAAFGVPALINLYLQCMCIAMYVVCYSLKSVASMEYVALQVQSVPSAPHTDGEGCNLYSSIIIQFLVTHVLYTCANIYALNLHEQLCKGVLKYLYSACTFAPASTR